MVWFIKIYCEKNIFYQIFNVMCFINQKFESFLIIKYFWLDYLYMYLLSFSSWPYWEIVSICHMNKMFEYFCLVPVWSKMFFMGLGRGVTCEQIMTVLVYIYGCSAKMIFGPCEQSICTCKYMYIHTYCHCSIWC